MLAIVRRQFDLKGRQRMESMWEDSEIEVRNGS